MVLVGLQDRCARFIVRVPAKSMGGALGGLLMAGLGSSKAQVRAQARLFWPDGSPAGHAVSDAWLGRALWGRPGLKCFAMAVFGRSRQGALAPKGLAPGELAVCAGVVDLLGN